MNPGYIVGITPRDPLVSY